MAPPNEAGTPANPGDTKRPPLNAIKAVIPALPLGFPQRPASTTKQAAPLGPSAVARSQPPASANQTAVNKAHDDRQQGQPLKESATEGEKHNGEALRVAQPIQHNGANGYAPPAEPMHYQGTGMKVSFCMLYAALLLVTSS